MSAQNTEKTLIRNTAAALAADTRAFPPDFELSPIDTADAGKHKLCDGIHTYSELSFIEDASGGSGITQLTGPVTAGPGSGSVATTITNGAIADVKLASMTAGTLKGRGGGGGSGAPEAIVPADELALVGQTIGLRIESLTALAPDADDLLIFADISDGNAKKAGTLAQSRAAIGSPNIYRAVLSNAGAVQTTVANQVGVTFTWSHPGAGQMRITADSGTPFTSGKTSAWAMPTSGGGGATLCDCDAGQDTSVINFFFFDPATGNAADPPGNFQAFIEVHP